MSNLDEYYSKNGGTGGNRPDAKLLLQDKELNYYPILIEYKGYKDKLVKLDPNGQVENRTDKNEPIFKNINHYAVNGAVHYANAILHYTSYTNIISIGVTGYKDEFGAIVSTIGVYYVSKDNFGVGQKVDDYSDLSFLKKENFDKFIEKIKALKLSSKEIKILNSKPNLKEFKIENLFKAKTGDVDLQQKDINGKGEYFINSGAENFGIKGKTDRVARIFEANTITVDFWGFSNYRNFKYKMATHNHIFSLSGNVIKNEKVGLYLSACMRHFTKIFSYNNMGTWKKIKKMTILLPVNEQDEIDYNYIKQYITAIQKLSIKNVILWRDKIIKKTKKYI